VAGYFQGASGQGARLSAVSGDGFSRLSELAWSKIAAQLQGAPCLRGPFSRHSVVRCYARRAGLRADLGYNVGGQERGCLRDSSRSTNPRSSSH
jgi:hypothetical protein